MWVLAAPPGRRWASSSWVSLLLGEPARGRHVRVGSHLCSANPGLLPLGAVAAVGQVGEGRGPAHAPVGGASCPGRPRQEERESSQSQRGSWPPGRAPHTQGGAFGCSHRRDLGLQNSLRGDPQRASNRAALGTAGPEGLACRGRWAPGGSRAPPGVHSPCAQGAIFCFRAPASQTRRRLGGTGPAIDTPESVRGVAFVCP